MSNNRASTPPVSPQNKDPIEPAVDAVSADIGIVGGRSGDGEVDCDGGGEGHEMALVVRSRWHAVTR